MITLFKSTPLEIGTFTMLSFWQQWVMWEEDGDSRDGNDRGTKGSSGRGAVTRPSMSEATIEEKEGSGGKWVEASLTTIAEEMVGKGQWRRWVGATDRRVWLGGSSSDAAVHGNATAEGLEA
ncbi:hypothetical protein GW17_00062516 [Ensete ventricosum]|nr:hypothetical protein GW17_00062516 [Ensete ventricosum]